MNLSAPFIRRPVMTTLLMVAILFAGLNAYLLLPVSSMPNVSYPTITVKSSLPGALPETMANAVALPMEKQFMAIPGMRLVSSSSLLGNTTIVLQFEIDKDILTAAQDVQEAITNAIPYLPPNLPYGPTYRKANPAELPIIYLSLTSETIPRSDLYTYGNTLIGQRISMIDGVSQVTTYGSPLAVRIQVDPAELAAKDITLTELAAQINLQNVMIATGQLDGSVEAPIISVDGQLIKAEEYDRLIVAYRNGTPIRIKDLGRAVSSFQNIKMITHYIDASGMQPSVTLAIQKDPSANTVEIADQIYTLLDSLKGDLPAAVKVHVVFDRSIPVRQAIKDAIYTLLISLILVVAVIYCFLGKIRDTVIPSLVLPLSVIGTFFVMLALGYTLDVLSVLALTLAVGFIIDDAVVVLENIVRKVEAGEEPYKAAMDGSREVCFTIVSMSLSLIAVFLPMLLMGGLIGKIFREFAVTLSIITILSGIISLTLTPMLCSLFIPPRDRREELKKRSRVLALYERSLMSVLHHRLTAVTIGLVLIIATFWLLFKIPTDFVPEEDLGFFVLYTQEREGGSSYSLLDNENKLVKIIQSHPEVDRFIAITSYTEYRKGLNFVALKPSDQRKPIQETINSLYKEIVNIPGLQGFIKNIPLIDLSTGQENRAAYQFALQSLSTDKLAISAERLLGHMKSDRRFVGVNSDLEINTPQINISIERDQASRLGLSATDVENAFNFGYAGNYVSRIQTAIDQYYVILELMPEYQKLASTFDKIWLRSNTNNLVPLSAATKWTEGLGASSINHINQFPSVTISFNLAQGVPLETALTRLEELAKEDLLPGVSARSIGAAQTFQESIQTAGYLILLTIFSIYIILGILYESYVHPITILTTLPPAMFGGLLTLLVFGLPLSMYSFLGLVLLIGIVKKNGIMMVDFAIDNMRYRKMDAADAIVDASLVRFRPIMMTTVAAIFGVLPIAFGFGANSEARRPLGYVVMGGLLFSQPITLFITPILCLAMERWQEYFRRRKR